MLSDLGPAIAIRLVQLEDPQVFGGRPLDFLDVWVEMIVPSNANNGEID